jgi:hypothetical protein
MPKSQVFREHLRMILLNTYALKRDDAIVEVGKFSAFVAWDKLGSYFNISKKISDSSLCTNVICTQVWRSRFLSIRLYIGNLPKEEVDRQELQQFCR